MLNLASIRFNSYLFSSPLLFFHFLSFPLSLSIRLPFIDALFSLLVGSIEAGDEKMQGRHAENKSF